MKTLMTTVMKTKAVAALLSWFSRHCFSTSFRFSRAGESGEREVKVRVGPQPGAPLTQPTRVQRKSGILEIRVADTKGGGVVASSLTDQSVGIHVVRHRIGVWELALGLLRVGMCSHGR